MLVVCYTNHALDQFLEGIYSFNKSIVRIGGKSQSDVLQSVNLNAMRKEKKSVPGHILNLRWEVHRSIGALQDQIALHELHIDNAVKNIIGFELMDTLQRFNSEHYQQLAGGDDFAEALLVFLGYKIVPQKAMEKYNSVNSNDERRANENGDGAEVVENDNSDDDDDNNDQPDEEIVDEEEVIFKCFFFIILFYIS